MASAGVAASPQYIQIYLPSP
ncbi:hypothetical protein E2C01_071811 [Portunus trituberculatus]|uniref:Uncharacterized protein n=1 Tax=Portunus trituberculatus TaxID=210409 RepID=A0A5B7I636_PORTR|nr:hypothetical protein [Portunus trituberculatus]